MKSLFVSNVVKIKEQYYVVRFIVEKTENGNTEFELSVLTYNGDIEEIKASSELKELMDRIKKFKDR